MTQTIDQFAPGQRVIVTQQIPRGDTVWTTAVEGQVVRFEQRKTGSWYAHARHQKLWLDRLILRMDDGEIVVCNLDNYTHVEIVPAASSGRPTDSPRPTEPEPSQSS